MRTLRVGFFTPVHNLDPEVVQDYVCGQIIEQLYDAPYALDDSGKPRSVLFDGPLVRRGKSSRSIELVGTIRPDAKFSDGSPVTATEVVESLRRVPSIASSAQIAGRDRKVVFTLPEDDSRFEVRLSHRWASIIKRQGDQLIGTGPFVLQRGWTPQHVNVDRNEHALRPAKIDRVEFQVLPSTKDLVQAINDGKIDLTTALARDDVAGLKGVRKDFQPGTSTAMLSFNTENQALADVEVRRAICEAIDRAEVARISYENPHAFTARSVLPPSMWRRGDGLRHDPKQARERLQKSGVKPSRPLRMVTIWGPRPYMPNPQETAQLIKRQLGRIGLEVDIMPTTDSLDYRARTRAGSYDLDLAGWIADTPDPFDFLNAICHSQSIPTAERGAAYANNLARYQSQRMDAALAGYRKDSSDQNLQRIMDIVSDDVPMCPLFYGPNVVVHQWRVRNLEISATGMPKLAIVELD
ncbi:MAG: ABC transporter substrate-binding protein [Myxococcota bacterium]